MPNLVLLEELEPKIPKLPDYMLVSQFLLDRIGRCLELFVSTVTSSCVSSAHTFFEREKHQNYRELKDGYVRWLNAVADTT